MKTEIANWIKIPNKSRGQWRFMIFTMPFVERSIHLMYYRRVENSRNIPMQALTWPLCMRDSCFSSMHDRQMSTLGSGLRWDRVTVYFQIYRSQSRKTMRDSRKVTKLRAYEDKVFCLIQIGKCYKHGFLILNSCNNLQR